MIQRYTKAAAVSVGVGAVLLAVVANFAPKHALADSGDAAYNTETDNLDENGKEGYETAQTDLLFWYEDNSYRTYFEKAAEDYYAKTQVKVQPVCTESLDYIGEIYDTTMQGEGRPDAYLLGGDCLEEAYLYGLAEENKNSAVYEDAVGQALLACAYKDKVYGYPLSFNSCVFVYQNGYFAAQPESLQSIIDYSDENEPPEHVEFLLEWNVNDPFYDFPFISNSVSFESEDGQSLDVVYNQELYEQDLLYFEQILASFSIDANTVTEESVIEHFLAGKTLCAIIDTKDLQYLKNYDYSLMQIPNLNESLTARTCATTDLIVVNPFSEKKEIAADFAVFATSEEAKLLKEYAGTYSVFKPQEMEAADVLAYESYENAVLAPDAREAKDFWIGLKETIHKYF